MNAFLFSLFLLRFGLVFVRTNDIENNYKLPTVFIAILVRNKAHTLPYFLTLFSQLDYPKSRIIIWIRSDHNEDDSAEVLTKWADAFGSQYHSIDLEIDNSSQRFEDEEGIATWPESRYRHLIELREEALQTARHVWANFVWFVDCDSFLTDSRVLQNLIRQQKTIVAPMLISDSMYSNFWCGMTPSYYYRRTDEYEEILNRKKTGCFPVPMIHSAVLVDLRMQDSDLLTFSPSKIAGYDGPMDDIIAFAVGANKTGIPLYVCNDLKYGYTTVPLEENEGLADDKNNLINLKLHVTVDDPPFPVDEILSQFVHFPSKSKLGFNEIFVINLKRRSERKTRMLYCLNELGIDFTFVEAVDGKLLKDDELREIGIKLMDGYEDPYAKRPMKKGEIGCFISHYKIWNKMIENDMKQVLILEDDVRFEKFFVRKLQTLIDDANRLQIDWDMIYIGRKIMKPKEESFVEGTDNLVYPDYTYWTIGYILNIQGAKKLVDAEPLVNLIPVDEFLPIMFDKHPRDDWKQTFPIRNLVALSVNPLIVFPMKYTNEEGYVSDTENSHILVNSSPDEL